MSSSEAATAKSIKDHDEGYMIGYSLVEQFNNMIEEAKQGKSSDFIYGLACAIEDDIDLRKE